jgi:Flp pilus assembly protein TadG
MTRWRTRLRGSRAERGAAAVEFAIVLTVLLLILLGIIDFGRLLFVSQAVKSASREGARVAAVRAPWGATPAGTGTNSTSALPNSTLATAQAASSAANALSGGGQVTFVGTGGTAPSTAAGVCTAAGASVSVAVSARFQWLTPVGALPGLSSGGLQGTRDVSSTTVMRCE